MADQKISQLPTAGAAQDSDVSAQVQNGNTVKQPNSAIYTYNQNKLIASGYFLLSYNNLSDLKDISASRSNLGVTLQNCYNISSSPQITGSFNFTDGLGNTVSIFGSNLNSMMQLTTTTKGSMPLPLLNSTQESSLVSIPLTSSDKGLSWYNSSINVPTYWDGTDVQRLLAIDNIIEGLNMTITNNGDGTVTFASSGGGSGGTAVQGSFSSLNSITLTTVNNLDRPIAVNPISFTAINQIGTSVTTSTVGGVTTAIIQNTSIGARWCSVSFDLTLYIPTNSGQTYSFTIFTNTGGTLFTERYTVLGSAPFYKDLSISSGMVFLNTNDYVYLAVTSSLISDPGFYAYYFNGKLVDTTVSSLPSTNALSQGSNNLYLSQDGGSTYQNISGSLTVGNLIKANTIGGQFIDSGISSSSVITSGSSAGGNLSGTYPNPIVSKVNGVTYNSNSVTDGQIPIGSTSDSSMTASTITGTANQVNVTNSSHSITLSLPQSIATSSSPQFTGLNVSGLTASSLVATDSSKNLTSTISGLSPTFTGLNLSGLSASLPVFTDSSKNLTSSGTVPFSNGGFGFSTATTGDLFYASATNTPNKLAAVATGSVLISNGTSTAPSWSSSPNISSAIIGSAQTRSGTSKLYITGSDSSTNGPNQTFYTTTDSFPLLQILPYSHENINISFDSYFDGSSWVSSNANSNYQFSKGTDHKFYFRFKAGIPVANTFTWTDVWNIDTSGNFTILTNNFNVQNLSASSLVFTDASKNLTTTGTAAVNHGGTGQTTYTDGQLLIGNSSGNTLTKANITGTSNQINVTNGNGSITLSLPQNINTAGAPTFSALTLSGSTNALTLLNNTNPINLENQANLQCKNSGGTYETFLIPRFSDNKMYIDIGSSGLVMRQNSAGSTFMSVDSSSNVNFKTGSVAINGTGSFGGGVGVLSILNATTTPTSNPTGGGILYTTSGALHYLGSSGTNTTVGVADPHCPECGSDFGWEWENEKFGGNLRICAACFSKEFSDRKYIRWNENKSHIH